MVLLSLNDGSSSKLTFNLPNMLGENPDKKLLNKCFKICKKQDTKSRMGDEDNYDSVGVSSAEIGSWLPINLMFVFDRARFVDGFQRETGNGLRSA